jgi:hypothetical protein
MVITEVTTIPTWRAQKQARSFFLIFSVQTYVHEKLLSCPLDKYVFNDPLMVVTPKGDDGNLRNDFFKDGSNS